ncbi:hypothetical protein QTP86_017396 [Hemibagrus guttatus]|nr:hypothetical protein QTP86_017396 [Hemibagrus guttatus]
MADFSAPCPVPESVVVVDPAAGSGTERDREMNITDSVEGEGLLESSMRLKPHEAQSYRKKALWVSWISIVVTLILAVAAFTVSFMRHSASAFGFAFDATLDVLTSVIVLWRYSNAAAVHSAHREYIACVILGVIFILSSMCILGKAIHDLSTKLLPEVCQKGHTQKRMRQKATVTRGVASWLTLGSDPNPPRMGYAKKEFDCAVMKLFLAIVAFGLFIRDLNLPCIKFSVKDDFLFSVSIVSGILCIILAIVKFMLGRVLTSRALITDGFNSLVGGIMGFSILISAEVFRHEPTVWFLDGTIGVLIGLIILAYGIK